MVTYGTLRKAIILLFLSFIIPAQGWGATWYVRPNEGSYGSSNGTSYADAFDGFSDISWGSIGGGDTLYVCGNFTGERIIVGASGSSGNPITIDGACPSDPGDIASPGGHGISNGRDYITIKNLSIHGQGSSSGITSSGCRNYMWVDNVEVYSGSGDGIVILGSHTKVLNSNIHNISKTGIWLVAGSCTGLTDQEVGYNTLDSIGTSGANYDGIFVGDGVGDMKVHHNTVTNFIGSGGGSCIDTSNKSGSPSATVEIYNNSLTDCTGYGIGAGDQNVPDTLHIHHNIINGATYGIALRALGTYYVYNNTITGSGSRGIWIPVAGTKTVTVKNNILTGSYSRLLDYTSSGLTLISDYNDFYKNGATYVVNTYSSLSAWQAASNDDDNSLDENPLFISSTDFHIQAGSPLIDAGTDVDLPSEYGGPAPDIGAGGEIGPGDGGTGTGTGSNVPNAPQITGIF